MKYSFVVVLAALFIAGCTHLTTEVEEQTVVETPEVSEVPVYNTGTFKPMVLRCGGDFLEIKNNGTGTILMNETSSDIKSRSGLNSYGDVTKDLLLHPGETGNLELSYNLENADTRLFNIETKIGTIRFMTPFDC
jgi:hypothetical protein